MVRLGFGGVVGALSFAAVACGGIANDRAESSPGARPPDASLGGGSGDAGGAPCVADGGCLMASCRTTADCNNEYLVCAPTPVSETTAGRTTDVILNLCERRYDLPCSVDADCGAGFSCVSDTGAACSGDQCTNTCRAEYLPCESDVDCRPGWSCFSPGPVDCSKPCEPFPPACYPPFAVFL